MSKIYFENAQEHQLKHFPKISWYKVKNSQAFLGIGAPQDTKELKHINPISNMVVFCFNITIIYYLYYEQKSIVFTRNMIISQQLI